MPGPTSASSASRAATAGSAFPGALPVGQDADDAGGGSIGRDGATCARTRSTSPSGTVVQPSPSRYTAWLRPITPSMATDTTRRARSTSTDISRNSGLPGACTSMRRT
ncbi:hypothetical protein NPJ82_11555 [Sphingomonas sp. NY01]|uniref:hypothetical protein n=1 Tax=Sphingomonas sp. NY01 TaxID=2968057 RepID=UPI00315DE33F